jgi:serine/threonine protein kinase
LHFQGNVLLRGLQYAQPVQEDQPLTGHFGYLYSWYAFKAPEIDSDFFHDKSVDLWSLGAIMYMLLTALPPFRGDGAQLISNKHAGNVEFDMVVPSAPAQQLVQGLLQVHPEHRLTIDEVLNHEWMIETDEFLAGFDLSLTKALMEDWERRPGS